MTVDALLVELSQAGIRLSAEAGQLSIAAPKGCLTGPLRETIARHKADIIAWLDQRRSTSSAPGLPAIVPDPDNWRQPFPFADLQVGFYLGSSESMEYYVRPHYYLELDYPALDVARYERAWHKALRRHWASLPVVTGNVELQLVADVPPVRIGITDLRACSADEAESKMLARRRRMERAELPLESWPWFDWHVTLYGANRARVHFNSNNFFSDGYGTQKLMAQAQRFYDEPELELPPLELSFRDCVLALQAIEESALGQRSLAYWRRRLPDLPKPPPLPQAARANPRSRSRLVRRSRVLPAADWRAFKEQAGRYGLTPTSGIFAVYAEVLARWSGSRHFIMNNMVTHRFPLHPQIKEVLGNFASLYPLEVDWRGALSFAARAQRLQQRLFEDVEHVYCGGMRVLQELNHAQGTPGRAPCPYVVGSGLFMESWELTEYSCLETSQTQLDHQFWELDDERYYVVWDLLEEFFPPGLIDAMWEAYLGLVVRLAREPAAWEAWQLLSLPAPQCRRRDEANATEATESTEAATPARLLNDLLARAAADYPDHDALVTPQRRLSYRELDGFANRIGRRLRAHGAMPGQLVAVVMEKGWEQVAAVAGILAAGAAYVPIDPGLPRQRLQYLLDNAQARIVLTQRHLDRAVDWPPTGLRLVVADDEFGDVDGSPLAPAQGSEDLAYVIYTSGSTGEPKGVMIDHRAALNTVIDINARGGVGPRDRLFGVSSLSFDLSVYDIFGAFAAGAALVLPSATRDPAHWRDLMASERVTVWNSAPALMQLLLDSGSGSAAFSALRLVMLSGDWIPVALPQRIQAQAPAAQVLGLGGATEASIWSIAYPIDRVDPDWQSVPYGKPLANQRWHVLDEAMLPCPDWVAGELYIAGAGLARGYWRDPEKTARSFIHHPVSGEPLYRTGDTGRYLPDGNIEFLGRRDFQVKIQGYRIELGEIEAALARHPQVSESVVVAPPDGRGGRQLLAYVVPAPTSSEAPRAEELQGFLGQCLPEYMIPGTFIFLPALPLTSNGKVDRKALPAPQRQRRTDPRPTRAPSERFEAELVEIWRELLGVDSLGVHDDFFELGGQSFTAIRMLLRVTQRCGRSLGLGAVLEERTIEGLARRLRAQEAPGAWSPLVSLHAAEGTPWFLVHPAGGSVTGYRALAPLLAVPLYGLQAAGLHGEATAVDDAPRMAGAYVEALRAVQPSGPYTLGGWSSGGAIAFEMARQLEASGERVARVVLIDSPAPLQHEAVAEATLLRWFFEDLDIGFPVERLAGATLEDVAPEKLLATALHYAPVAAGLGVEELAPIWSVFKATIRAGRAYRAQAIEAPLWVLRAEDRVVSEFADHPADADAAWGWGRYTSGPVATASLPGNHHTLLRAPNVHRLAATLHRLAAETPAGSAAQKQMKATPQG